ncbi:MAG TPA: 30S ribosomal protein S6 [Verrucomicrobiae bacterium]
MKRYEGLFILNTAGKEESVNDVVNKIAEEIVAAGGKVETIQKMDKKSFVRTPNRKVTAGFYVNIIFTSKPSGLTPLQNKLSLNNDVYRVMINHAPVVVAKADAAA